MAKRQQARHRELYDLKCRGEALEEGDLNQIPQAEDWSIFTDQIKYIQHDERSKYRFNLRPLNYQ